MKKLGDAVAVIAQPVAKVADTVLDTDLQNCGGCAKRQKQLNNLGDSIYDMFWPTTKEK